MSESPETTPLSAEDAVAKALHPFVCGTIDGPGVPECLQRARSALARATVPAGDWGDGFQAGYAAAEARATVPAAEPHAHTTANEQQACPDCREAVPAADEDHRPVWRDDVPTGWCECGKPHPHTVSPSTGDAASEYGRLLAARDRLVSTGVDPEDLDVPLSPSTGDAE